MLIGCCILIYGCNPRNNTSKKQFEHKTEERQKPGSSFQDTLSISKMSAVFYQPDSLQLSKIKAVTTTQVFEGSMHEWQAQFNNAHLVLKRNWPKVSIVDVKNVRYLKFIKKDQSVELVDLDKYNDAMGLFIFNGEQKPVLVEMTNPDEAFYFYFSKK